MHLFHGRNLHSTEEAEGANDTPNSIVVRGALSQTTSIFLQVADLLAKKCHITE